MEIIKQQLQKDKNFLQDFFQKKYETKLVSDYFNYIDYENIVVFSSKYLDEIYKITSEIDKIMIKSYKFYLENLEQNLENEFSLFWDFLWYFRVEDYLIWRYDVIIEKQTKKLKFIELNANTPGMITDIYHISQIEKENIYNNINSNFSDYIKDFFTYFKWKKLWILLPMSYEDEDYLVCRDYADILENTFWKENIIIWDIYESNIIANDYFTIKWEKIDLLINFFPLEFFLSDIDYANDFFSLIKNEKIKIFNNFESIILQDKLNFANIWENIEKFSKEEQEIIKNHIPFTTRNFIDNDKYIAKYRWWRVWRWVYDKNFYTNIENKNDYIFQEKIDSEILNNENEFLILWIYTNFKQYNWLISRKQKKLITNDIDAKICLCYKKD